MSHPVTPSGAKISANPGCKDTLAILKINTLTTSHFIKIYSLRFEIREKHKIQGAKLHWLVEGCHWSLLVKSRQAAALCLILVIEPTLIVRTWYPDLKFGFPGLYLYVVSLVKMPFPSVILAVLESRKPSIPYPVWHNMFTRALLKIW